MIMFIIAMVLMIPYVIIKGIEFVMWFNDDPEEAFYEVAPLLALMGMIIFFCELITCRM